MLIYLLRPAVLKRSLFKSRGLSPKMIFLKLKIRTISLHLCLYLS